MSHLHHLTAEANLTWFKVFEPLSAFRGNIVAFHHAGGNYLIYRDWTYLRKLGFRLCLLCLPGRLDTVSETFDKSFEEVIDEIYKQSLYLIDEPYVFFGHSMGGLLAYELAHRLQLANKSLPSHLFVSSTRAPKVQICDRPLHLLPDKEFVEEVSAYGGMPAEITNNKDLMDLVVPPLKKDFKLISEYKYQTRPVLSLPITMIYGEDDPKLTLENTQGWKDETTAYYKQYILSGGHFYLIDQQKEVQRLIWHEILSSR